MQTVNLGTLSATNPTHVSVSDKQDINDKNTLYNLTSSLKALKTKNSKRLVFGNLNINTINNKFEQLKYIIKNNIDALSLKQS